MTTLPKIITESNRIVTSPQNTSKSYGRSRSTENKVERNPASLIRNSTPEAPKSQNGLLLSNRELSDRSIGHSFLPEMESVTPRRSTDAFPHTHAVPVEKCWKCLLKVDHRVHDTQRFIRIGGGYRHGYYYLKVLLEQIEIEKQQAEILRARLETIKEKGVRTIKTFIRTKSGKLMEKVITVSEEDYQKIAQAMNDAGGKGGDGAANPELAELLKKYMSSEEAAAVQSLDTSEQKAITATFRTSSGREVEKIIYVSNDDYEAMQRGDLDMNSVLAKQKDLQSLLDSGTTLQGWKETKMKTITTTVRTKSGRVIEQKMQISEDDYRQLQAGKDLGIVLKKYMDPDQAAAVQSWNKPEKTEMKAIKTIVRTKSGRMVERTAMLTKEEYEAFQKSGGNPDALKAFLGLTAADKIEKFEAASTVYSASDDEAVEGELVQDSQGNVYQYVTDPITGKVFKKKLDKQANRELIAEAEKKGTLRGPDGKKVGGKRAGDGDAGGKSGGGGGGKKTGGLSVRRGKAAGGANDGGSEDSYSYRSVHSTGGTRKVVKQHKREDGTYSPPESVDGDVIPESKKKKRQNKGGGRVEDSDAFSYRSEVSAGGRRHVKRTRVHIDGTRSPEESDHGSFDAGEAKNAKGTKSRKTVKVLTKKPIFDQFGNVIGEQMVEEEIVLADSDDDEYEEGQGTRKGGTKFKKKMMKVLTKKTIYDDLGNAIGEEMVEQDVAVYDDDDYADGDDADDEDGYTNGKKGGRRKKKGKANADDDGDDESDLEYFLDEKGLKVAKRQKKGKNIVGDDDADSDSKDSKATGKRKRKVAVTDKNGDLTYNDVSQSESEFSVYSVVSAGGTKKKRKKQKIRDKEGKVIGYAESDSYSSEDSESNSDFSVFSEITEGGTRMVSQRKRIRDKGGKVIGYAKKKVVKQEQADPDFITVSDGKGGVIKIPKVKKSDGEGSEEDKKKKKGKRGVLLGEPSLSPVFSEASTDAEDEEQMLANMTEDEKRVYMEEKTKRKKEREKRRIEKYGEEVYKEMKAEDTKRKKYKSMVTYSRGASRFGSDESDDREFTRGHDEWGKKDKKQRGKKPGEDDGSDSDATTTETIVEDAAGNKIKVIRKGSKVIKRMKQGADGKETEVMSDDVDSDEELVVETRNVYDEYGNVIGTKKVVSKRKKKDEPGAKKGKGKAEGSVPAPALPAQEEVDKGDYFETDDKGNIKLKPGKKKIDISKLSKDDLKKMGLDPDSMTKAELMKALKAKFGDDLDINDRGMKIGTKKLEEYGYNPTVAELADDLDLDLSTLRGAKRLAVMQKRFGPHLAEHSRNLIQVSKLKDNIEPEEAAEHSIDFITAYKLVDSSKLDAYAKAFAVEDEDLDHKLSYKAARLGLESVPSIGHVDEKQMDYVLTVLGVDPSSTVTFRMFAVIVALCERVTAMDDYCKELIKIVNLLDIERKLQLYKEMFMCNDASYRSPTHIQVDTLRIELMAGGLSWEQQDYVIEKLQPSGWGDVSFLDYLCYIPLFLSMHENICDNPLDMSNTKYRTSNRRQPSAAIQRDMVPMGLPMRRNVMATRSKLAAEARRLLDPTRAIDKEEQIRRGTELLSNKTGISSLHKFIK